MLDLRCGNHLHLRFDLRRLSIHVKCHKCTRKRGGEVFHAWTWPELLDAEISGKDVVWPCEEPNENRRNAA